MNQLEHVCRICLVGADTLQSIEGTKLQDTFEMLSQTQLIGRDLTKSVCNTCRSLLRKCQRLKQFVQESESWLKLMLLYGTTADTVAEQVVNRKPHNLQRIKTVVLSISATVNLPVTQVKTEAEDIVKELVLSKKDEVSVENDIEPTEEPQVVMKVDVELQRDDESGGKEEVEVKMGNIKVLENEESSTENEVTDCENKEIAIIKDQIAMLKEEIAKEIEQKVRKKDKNAVENEEVLIKEELIEQGEGSEEELGKVSVKEEMEVEDDRIPECIKREPTETANTEDGLVNVSSSTLLNELQRVLRQNSGLLPEIKEMELDSTQVITPDKKYKCIICERGFTSEVYRELHMRKHKEDTPYGCRHCRRAFSKQAHLDCHMRIHKSDKEHECKICEVTFHTGDLLSSHMRKHISERHLCCRKCKKRYKTIQLLKDHYKTHKKKSKTVGIK